MKFNRFLASLILTAAGAAVPVVAQTRPAATQPKPAATQPKPAATQPAPAAATSSATVPDTKIALIYSEAFLDPKVGIARFAALMSTLEREFQAKKTEIQQLESKITQLQDEITKLQSAQTVVSPDTFRTKQDQLEQLKRDYTRKGEDAQAAYTRRRGEIFQPLNDDIGKALEVYAKAHNINVIIDGSQVPFVYAADAIDITRAFIVEFNTKNPATAAVAAPK
jgi:Skp family chaperone for outer membrane proteins